MRSHTDRSWGCLLARFRFDGNLTDAASLDDDDARRTAPVAYAGGLGTGDVGNSHVKREVHLGGIGRWGAGGLGRHKLASSASWANSRSETSAPHASATTPRRDGHPATRHVPTRPHACITEMTTCISRLALGRRRTPLTTALLISPSCTCFSCHANTHVHFSCHISKPS